MKEILITSPSTHIDPWEIMPSVDEWNLTKHPAHKSYTIFFLYTRKNHYTKCQKTLTATILKSLHYMAKNFNSNYTISNIPGIGGHNQFYFKMRQY